MCFPDMHAGATSSDLEIADIIVLQSQRAHASFYFAGHHARVCLDPNLNLTTSVSRSSPPLSELHDPCRSPTFHGIFEKWPFVPSLTSKKRVQAWFQASTRALRSSSTELSVSEFDQNHPYRYPIQNVHPRACAVFAQSLQVDVQRRYLLPYLIGSVEAEVQ